MSVNEITAPMVVSEQQLVRIQVSEWTVSVTRGPDAGKSASTLNGLVRVGADESNDLFLSDATVSRFHLEIERTAQGLVARDVGSRNGSFLGHRRIGNVHVEPGDVITLGKTELTLKPRSSPVEVELLQADGFGELVGRSEAMQKVFADLRRLASSDLTVLIEGETGTGKELAARSIHQYSRRSLSPFRVVDCTMLGVENVERELFGTDGAFATKDGVVFLDEVAALPAQVQPKLLRAIENGADGNGTRVIASTGQNLQEEIHAGRFRSDLFFRLSVGRVRMPALRTRRSDIGLLSSVFIERHRLDLKLSQQTISLLEAYEWPGNVRELRNTIERGALLTSTGTENWAEIFFPNEPSIPKSGVLKQVSQLPYHEAKDRILGEFEKQYFTEMMRTCGFDHEAAAVRSGMSIPSLYRLLKKNGIRVKDLKHG